MLDCNNQNVVDYHKLKCYNTSLKCALENSVPGSINITVCILKIFIEYSVQ